MAISRCFLHFQQLYHDIFRLNIPYCVDIINNKCINYLVWALIIRNVPKISQKTHGSLNVRLSTRITRLPIVAMNDYRHFATGPYSRGVFVTPNLSTRFSLVASLVMVGWTCHFPKSQFEHNCSIFLFFSWNIHQDSKGVSLAAVSNMFSRILGSAMTGIGLNQAVYPEKYTKITGAQIILSTQYIGRYNYQPHHSVYKNVTVIILAWMKNRITRLP